MTSEEKRKPNLFVDREEAEIACRLIGTALREPGVVMPDLTQVGLVPEDFTAPNVGPLWSVCLEHWRHTGRLESTLVERSLATLLDDEWLAGDLMRLVLKAKPVPRAELGGLVDHMRKRVASRRLIRICGQTATAAGQDYADPIRLIETHRGHLDAIAGAATTLVGATGAELAALALRCIQDGEEPFEHVPLGLPAIDEALGGGAIMGRVCIIGAATGVGKSTYATHIVTTLLQGGYRVLWFSLGDADRREVSKQIVTMRAGFDYPKKAERMSGARAAALAEAAGFVSDAPIYVDDTSSLTVEQIATRSRAYKHTHGVNVVVVDYVQDLHFEEGLKTHLAHEHGSNVLKRLAKDDNLCVIGLSQVVEKERGEKLDAESTAGSKRWGKDAAETIMLSRDKAAKNPALRDVSCAALVKNRFSGVLTECHMRYDHKTKRLVPCDEKGEDIGTIIVPAPRDPFLDGYDDDEDDDAA